MHSFPLGLDAHLTGATANQRRVHDLIKNGPRGSVPSPFFAMLDAPDLAAVLQEVGAAIRFNGSLSDAERELAILSTANTVGCGYEWNYHAPIAMASGVSPLQIAATTAEEISDDIGKRQACIIRFCREVAASRNAAEALFADAVTHFGREGVTELILIAGYYGLLASFIFIGGRDEPFKMGVIS